MTEKEENIEEKEVVKFFVELSQNSTLIDWKKITPLGTTEQFKTQMVRLSKDNRWTIISVLDREEDTILLPNEDAEKVAEGLRFWKAYGKKVGAGGKISINKLCDDFENTTFEISHLDGGRVFNFL